MKELKWHLKSIAGKVNSSFNRTMKELKLGYSSNTFLLEVSSFNRTMKELKLSVHDEVVLETGPFNRTMKELKY